MNCIDLTETDDEEDIIFVKNQTNDVSLKSNCMNKEIYNFYYGTESVCDQYLSVQYPAVRRLTRQQYSIKCPKCSQLFTNCNFLNHLIDHYKYEYQWVDSLLLPRYTVLANSLFNDITDDSSFTGLRCEICLLDFSSPIALGQHFQEKHVHRDMPYVCFVCNFYQTSFLSKLFEHFYEHHRQSEYVFCPFCIQTFELMPFDNGGNSSSNRDVLDPNLFIAHIERHLLKKQFFCDKCSLKFLIKASLIFHRAVYHFGRNSPKFDSMTSNYDSNGNRIVKKSLNVGFQPIDVSKLKINSLRMSMVCVECRDGIVNLQNHFQHFKMCAHCGFRSHCVQSFARHMKLFHNNSSGGCNSNNNGNNNVVVPVDLPNSTPNIAADVYPTGVLICNCGFRTLHGDEMSAHLFACNTSKSCFIFSRTDFYTSSHSTDDGLVVTDKRDEFYSLLDLGKSTTSQ